MPPEEKWALGGVAEAPAPEAPPAGAGVSSPWLPGGPGRRPPVEPTDRQQMAVEAYCHELCAPDEARTATAEALAAFGTAAARLGQRATPDDHERVLARATRLAAARHATVGSDASGWRSRIVDALAAERDVGCRRVPALLAQRGNGEPAGADGAALRDHLQACLSCRALEVRMARAERSFAAALRLGVTA